MIGLSRLFFILLILEALTFLAVAGLIGAGPALLLCLMSFLTGIFLIRHEGLGIIRGLQQRQGLRPDMLQTGFAGVAAGFLLMFPGFLTDLAALALLVPAVRRRASGQANAYFRQAPGNTPPHRGDTGVIEGVYEVVEGDGVTNEPRHGRQDGSMLIDSIDRQDGHDTQRRNF